MFVVFVRWFKSKEDVLKYRFYWRFVVIVVLYRIDIIIRYMDVKSIEVGLVVENYIKFWMYERWLYCSCIMLFCF